MRRSMIVLFSMVGLAPAAFAAPAELLNKSVHVSFITTIPAKAPDGTVAPRTRNNSFVIYISSAGRMFSRIARMDGRASTSISDSDPSTSQGHYRFDGNRLVGVQTYASGAAQMIVTFQSGGCNASFISGRDSGRAFRFKGNNGVTYEATGPASWSNVNCSVSDGNAFAN